MKPYTNEQISLRDEENQENEDLQFSQQKNQLSFSKSINLADFVYDLKNCNQKSLIISIIVFIICWLLFLLISFIFFGSSTNFIINDSFFTPETTLTLTKNTLMYGKKIPEDEVPIMKMAKMNNITQNKIQNAIKYMQILPAEKSKVPEKMSIFEQLSKEDLRQLDKQYQIIKHQQKQISFCIVLPSLTNKQSPESLNMVRSILRQNYRNYKLVWPKSNQQVQDEQFQTYLKRFGFELSRSHKIQNTFQSKLERIYHGIKNNCIVGEVVILIDDINFLIGKNVLSLLNSVYQSKQPSILYTEYLKLNYSKLTAELGDLSEIQGTYNREKSFKNVNFVHTMHVVCFDVGIFSSVPIDYLMDENHKFYQELWQDALFNPLFSLAGSNFYYLNQIIYVVNSNSSEPIDKSQLHYVKISDQIKNKKQLQPLTNAQGTFSGSGRHKSDGLKSQKNDLTSQQVKLSHDKQLINTDLQQNLLKNEENDMTISQDQQKKVDQIKTAKKDLNQLLKKDNKLNSKNQNYQKSSTINSQTKISFKQKQNQYTQQTQTYPKRQKSEQQSKNSQKTNQKYQKSHKSDSSPKFPTLNQKSDLKEPILVNTYDERNPLQSPTLVNPQNQNNHRINSAQPFKKPNIDQRRIKNQNIHSKQQEEVLIDGTKVIKSTQVLPVDQVGGFFQIDEEQEDQQEYQRPKLDKKQQPKKIALIGAGKMEVKGPHYTFDWSIEDMINNVDMDKIFGKKKSKEGVWKNQFLQAIQKLQITNNVKYGGQIDVQLTKFDNDKFEKVKRIQDLLKTDTDYLDAIYKINEYKKKQLPFCIIVPSYQNIQSGLYLRNLNSIFMQNYTNYRVVYVDDASTDKTGEYVKSYILSRNIPLQKIQIITNKDNRKPPYNIYNAITNHCKLGQLAMIVQGDDALLGTNILSLYNAIYQRDKCAMIYSSYLQIFQNSRVQLGVAHQIMDEYFQKNSIRTISQIPGKYLLSFYVDIFKSIQVQEFKDPKGYFFWFAYDRALITPLLQVSYPRISILKQIIYEHRRDSGKESLSDWNRESKQILAKKPYKPLKFFPFIQRNKYKYFIDASIDQVIENSDFDGYTFLNNFEVEGISKDMHIRSIKLLQVIHNVRYGGQIFIQLAEYESSKEQKYKRLEKLLEEDKKYYNQKYDIDFYRRQELPFCIITPSYNNVKSGLYLRNLDSMFMQDYNNYHIVYIDDCSPDKTGQFVKKYLEERKIPQKHIEVIINKVNKKAMYNLHMGIHKHCKSGQIVAIIDGDDSFLGRNVLSLYNAIYQKEKAAMAYSNFLTIHNNDRTQRGFCHEIDKEMFEQNTFRNSWDLPGTHLMTFYSDLFKKIKISDLTYPNGTFYDYAYDRAILTPLLEMAYPRISVIKEITYEYRNDTGINDAPDDWTRVSHIILDKKPYAHLQEFPFIKGLIESTDKFNIKAEIETAIKNTNLSMYEQEPNKKITGIAKEQHIHAIRLTQLVHNVKFDGKVDVSLKNNKNAQKKKQRLQKLLKNDKEYMQTKYNISKYKQKQLPFCIVVSSHNSVQNGLYLRNLNSIFMQDYKNYRIIYIDDNSPEESEEYIRNYLKEQLIPPNVIKMIRVQDTKRQLSNIYFSAHNHCELNEIMLIVSESDALIGRNVLSVLNAKYQKEKGKVGFSCYLKVFNSSTELGSCGDIKSYYFQTGTFRNYLQYEQYRLMSFYTSIFRRIKIRDLTYENGTFYSTAIDKAIMIPLIQMSYPDVLIVKDIMYEDRFEEDSRDAAKQAAQANLILSKEPYKRIEAKGDNLVN